MVSTRATLRLQHTPVASASPAQALVQFGAAVASSLGLHRIRGPTDHAACRSARTGSLNAISQVSAPQAPVAAHTLVHAQRLDEPEPPAREYRCDQEQILTSPRQPPSPLATPRLSRDGGGLPRDGALSSMCDRIAHLEQELSDLKRKLHESELQLGSLMGHRLLALRDQRQDPCDVAAPESTLLDLSDPPSSEAVTDDHPVSLFVGGLAKFGRKEIESADVTIAAVLDCALELGYLPVMTVKKFFHVRQSTCAKVFMQASDAEGILAKWGALSPQERARAGKLHISLAASRRELRAARQLSDQHGRRGNHRSAPPRRPCASPTRQDGAQTSESAGPVAEGNRYAMLAVDALPASGQAAEAEATAPPTLARPRRSAEWRRKRNIRSRARRRRKRQAERAAAAASPASDVANVGTAAATSAPVSPDHNTEAGAGVASDGCLAPAAEASPERPGPNHVDLATTPVFRPSFPTCSPATVAVDPGSPTIVRTPAAAEAATPGDPASPSHP